MVSVFSTISFYHENPQDILDKIQWIMQKQHILISCFWCDIFFKNYFGDHLIPFSPSSLKLSKTQMVAVHPIVTVHWLTASRKPSCRSSPYASRCPGIPGSQANCSLPAEWLDFNFLIPTRYEEGHQKFEIFIWVFPKIVVPPNHPF